MAKKKTDLKVIPQNGLLFNLAEKVVKKVKGRK